MRIPEAILASIESMPLPSIPEILLQFMHLVEDDHTSMAELAALVGQDPSLTARVLTMANSPALRGRAGAHTLIQCMVNLGARRVRSLAACLVVQEVFPQTAYTQTYNFTDFWGHSVRVGEMARDLASKLKYPHAEEAYLAGLLHDVGQLLLLGGVGDRYGDLLESCSDEPTLHDLEYSRFGTDHAAIGAWLVDQWQLPSFMADSILFHHKSAEEIASADSLSQIVWSAHVVCAYHTRAEPTQQGHTPDFAVITAMLGIDPADVFSMYEACSGRVAHIASSLGLSESSDATPFPHTAVVSADASCPLQNARAAVHSQMADVVRDMALMQPLQQELALLESEVDILLALRESARILFGLGQPVFLLVAPGKRALSGVDVDGQLPLLSQLEIPLETKQSLAATVIVEKQSRTTFEKAGPAEISLFDTQIIRILGSEGLLYVPLNAHERVIGVMVYGISSAQSGWLQKRINWMANFAHLAAASIEAWRSMHGREQTLEAALTKRFEQQARKVVHEASNPLGIIKNYLNIVRQKLPDQNSMLHELDILREEIDRVTHIVRRMGNATEALSATGKLDINSVIENMLVLYEESLFTSRGITVKKTLDPRLVLISSDQDSIKQILLNIWNNAGEAMASGGSFVISTHNDVNQNGRASIEIRLSDSGPGLPSDIMPHLFKPLDPNRRPGHSGVGLSIVAGLVERLDGCITCQSEAGRGTVFSILLPQPERDAT